MHIGEFFIAVRKRADNYLAFSVIVILEVNSPSAVDAVKVVEFHSAVLVRANDSLSEFVFQSFVHNTAVAVRTLEIKETFRTILAASDRVAFQILSLVFLSVFTIWTGEDSKLFEAPFILTPVSLSERKVSIFEDIELPAVWAYCLVE